MKEEKILDRIRKLLAMSKDTSSPYEAAIAAGRARKMMDKFQVSELDLTTVSDSDMAEEGFDTGMKTQSTVVSSLAVAVATLNDCHVVIGTVRGHKVLTFQGMFVDAVCAIELMKYLKDEMYKQAKNNATGRADRSAYRLGFAAGVTNQVRKIMRDRKQLKTEKTGTALVACKQQLVNKHFGATRYKEQRTKFSGSAQSYYQGKEAGMNASLNRQVNGAGQPRLNN